MAEAVAPTDGRMYLERARIAELRGAQADEVIRWLELAISHSPYPAGAFEALQRQYEALGNYQAAVETLRKGIELYPDRSGFLYTLGIHLTGMGRFEQAIQALAEYVERVPGSAPPWVRLARAFAGAEKTEEAVKSYLHAARLREARGELQLAVEIYCEALKLSPDEISVKNRLRSLGASCPDAIK